MDVEEWIVVDDVVPPLVVVHLISLRQVLQVEDDLKQILQECIPVGCAAVAGIRCQYQGVSVPEGGDSVWGYVCELLPSPEKHERRF